MTGTENWPLSEPDTPELRALARCAHAVIALQEELHDLQEEVESMNDNYATLTIDHRAILREKEDELEDLTSDNESVAAFIECIAQVLEV